MVAVNIVYYGKVFFFFWPGLDLELKYVATIKSVQ